jgi:hypothetical protein
VKKAGGFGSVLLTVGDTAQESGDERTWKLLFHGVVNQT